MARSKRKRAASEKEEKAPEPKRPPPKVSSEDLQPQPKKGKWINKQRVLVFSSRGISYRDRHLMEDLRTLMAHAKSDTKMDRKDKLFIIDEIAEMKNCSKVLFFEARKHKDLYLWMSNTPDGPSARFHVQNVHTMEELKLTGNCLKATRPLLSFDSSFDAEPHYKLLKEMFIQTFGTPKNHPKTQPFFDHVFTFAIADNRIWFRNYQIFEEDGSLREIGPRFVLSPIKIFDKSFRGATLYESPHYVSPNLHRRMIKLQSGNKYTNSVGAKQQRKERKLDGSAFIAGATDDVFCTIDPAEVESALS